MNETDRELMECFDKFLKQLDEGKAAPKSLLEPEETKNGGSDVSKYS